jgi:hypothetical protein
VKKRNQELLRLLELDYASTAKLTEGLVGGGLTIRGWAITLTSALVGLAFQAHLRPLALLAVAVVLLFGLADAYHSWLYSRVMAHAESIENTMRTYYSSLARGDDDPVAEREFEIALLAHSFGRFAEARRFSLASLAEIRPKLVFVVMYLTLLVCALGAAALVGSPGSAVAK